MRSYNAATSRIILVLGLTVLAIVTAACGGNGGGGPSGGQGTNPTVTPSQTATATLTATPSATPTATPTPVIGACLPASSLSVMVQGTTVTSYVAMGSWKSAVKGISLIQIEGPSPTPAATLITTPNVVNSCASNSMTGQTVCTANNNDVYLLSGSTLTQTLPSGASGEISFSGGVCTNCEVTFNPATNQALIGLAVSNGVGGFQFLDLGGVNPVLEPPFASQEALSRISEAIMVDPTRNLILSANEANDYELVQLDPSNPPAFYENLITNPGGLLDGSAEDCTTGIALASNEYTNNLFLADLSNATFTPGAPGTWSAPSQFQNIPEFAGLFSGICGVVIAPSSHLGIVTGESGGSLIGAIQLPSSTSGSAPSLTDWLACNLPDVPTGSAFRTGDDPHTVTAYVSPNTNDAMALVADQYPPKIDPNYVAVVDLTKMFDPTIVPRTGHTCTANTLPSSVVSYVPVSAAP